MLNIQYLQLHSLLTANRLFIVTFRGTHKSNFWCKWQMNDCDSDEKKSNVKSTEQQINKSR